MRTQFHWDVELQRHDGRMFTERVSAFWSPDHEGTREAVGSAARIQALQKSAEGTQFAVISVAEAGSDTVEVTAAGQAQAEGAPAPA